jgi:ABC-type lipoprotein export system ATPase subunit
MSLVSPQADRLRENNLELTSPDHYTSLIQRSVSFNNDLNTTQSTDVELGIPVLNSTSTSFYSAKEKKLRDLRWSFVNYSVGKKQILHNCWGEVKSKQICAIMGLSGAGKSSLLNVLAGRLSSADDIRVEGKVQVGGLDVNPLTYRKNIAYVMQEDYLMTFATPREAISFSANLRLPSSFPSDAIPQKVDELIKSLGLNDCADVMIGGDFIPGISGGQKKRTSVGIELVTDPTVSLICSFYPFCTYFNDFLFYLFSYCS